MYTKRRLFVVNEKDAHTHICTCNVRVMYDVIGRSLYENTRRSVSYVLSLLKRDHISPR